MTIPFVTKLVRDRDCRRWPADAQPLQQGKDFLHEIGELAQIIDEVNRHDV